MRISRLTWHRIFGISLGLWAVFLLASDWLEWGFFSELAEKRLMTLTVGVAFVWGAFFMPTRQELREDTKARRAKRNR